jgi:hypothetical protein
MASRSEPQGAQHPRTRKRHGSMTGCSNNRRPGSATTRDRFRSNRTPQQPGSRVSSQVVVPALLSGSGRDNPQSTTSSGTQRARSRLRRPPLPASEFVLLPARIRSLVSRTAGIIPRIFRILKTDQKAVPTACPMRAMTPGLYEVVIQNNLVEEVGSELAASERGRNRRPCRDPRPAREQRRDENQGTR